MQFDYLALGDAAAALGIPRPTLRYFCDMGKIVAKRASDGSRLIAPEEVERAREWLKEHARQKEQERKRVAKNRQLKAQIEARRIARLDARRAKRTA